MRNVIVTGGSRGLGLGIARKLILSGFRAIAIARKETSDLVAAKSEIEPTHPGALNFVPADLAEIDALPELVKRLRKEFGPIYGLVNNAGMSADGVLAHDLDATDRAGRSSEHDLTHCAHQTCRARNDGR